MPEDPLKDCKEQFFKSGRTPSDRSLQSFSSKLEKIIKKWIFSSENKLSSKSLLVKWNALLTISLHFLRQCCRMFFPQLENSEETQMFLEKTVQPKNSFGHIKCSYDEPAKSSYRTSNTFSLKFRWKTRVFFRGKKEPYSKLFSYSTFLDKSPENF